MHKPRVSNPSQRVFWRVQANIGVILSEQHFFHSSIHKAFRPLPTMRKLLLVFKLFSKGMDDLLPWWTLSPTVILQHI